MNVIVVSDALEKCESLLQRANSAERDGGTIIDREMTVHWLQQGQDVLTLYVGM